MAFFTIFIWGTTYVATKTLLTSFTPFEILLVRFTIAFLCLLVFYPKFSLPNNWKDEIIFCCLGLTGVTLYFLFENTALVYTYATNVGIIVSCIPILTVLISHYVFEDEKINKSLLIGFVLSFFGVFLVIFNGKFVIQLNPIGDFLALGAAVLWAIFSNLVKKTDASYHPILVVRKTFFYGIIAMIPLFLVYQVDFSIEPFLDTTNILCFCYLAFIASSACFITWNRAIKTIGAVNTSKYIYLLPLITMISSLIMLDEQVNFIMIAGAFLILYGVYVSEKRERRKKELSSAA